jgi:hypothetical protein
LWTRPRSPPTWRRRSRARDREQNAISMPPVRGFEGARPGRIFLVRASFLRARRIPVRNLFRRTMILWCSSARRRCCFSDPHLGGAHIFVAVRRSLRRQSTSRRSVADSRPSRPARISYSTF